MRFELRTTLACCVVLACAATAGAVAPSIWSLSGREGFAAGEPSGVSLTRDGEIRLAPTLERIAATEEPRTWALAASPDGVVYVAAGTDNHVYRVGGTGVLEPFFAGTEDQVTVQAVEWGPDGYLYVATGPAGAIYRVPPEYDGGEAAPWFAPEQTYVWDMVFDREGSLYLATGDDGVILRVDRLGSGEILFDSDETHITSLALDAEGNLLAGSEAGGLVYRIDHDGGVFVLLDAAEPEVNALVATDDGVFVGTFGGTGPGTMPVATASAPPAVATVAIPVPVSVTDAAAAGAVYLVRPDGLVDSLWRSSEDGVQAMVATPDGVVVGTGPRGRVYRIGADGSSTLLFRVDAAQVTALETTPDGNIVASTGNPGHVYRLGGELRLAGDYLSPVKDTRTTSRWGALRWRARTPEGTGVQMSTRSGNTQEPDVTWSDWSQVPSDPAGSPIESPAARFVQWRAELTTENPALTPSLQAVELVYVQRNLAPVVSRFVVHPGGVAYRDAGGFDDGPPFNQVPDAIREELARMGSSSSSSASASASASSGRTFLGRPYWARGMRTLTWEATDPNGDSVEHALEFRGDGESVWKPLESGLDDSQYALDTTRLPDGAYRVRVAVSDAPSNPVDRALVTRAASPVFVIDNTPPAVGELSVEQRAGEVAISGAVIDETSLIRHLEYSVDGAAWVTVLPADGFADTRQERVAIRLVGLEPGEHAVIVRAVDEAFNRGAGKALVVVR